MSRCRVSEDELDYDTQQGQWKPSIFDHMDEVAELEPDTNHSLDGHWVMENGKEVWKPRKGEFVGPDDGFKVWVDS